MTPQPQFDGRDRAMVMKNLMVHALVAPPNYATLPYAKNLQIDLQACQIQIADGGHDQKISEFMRVGDKALL